MGRRRRPRVFSPRALCDVRGQACWPQGDVSRPQECMRPPVWRGAARGGADADWDGLITWVLLAVLGGLAYSPGGRPRQPGMKH